MSNKSKVTQNIDCLFIHVPNLITNGSHDPIFFINMIAIGLFSISNELKKNGFTPQIINLGVEKAVDFNFNIAKYIQENNIKIIGLSLQWCRQIYDTLAVAESIKKMNPDTFIFLGGITSSAFATEILKDYPQIDAVVKGEGEKPIVELVNKIKNQDFTFFDIPNINWRDKEGKIHKNKKLWFANEEELNSFSFIGLDFLKNHEIYLKFPMHYRKNSSNLEENICRHPAINCCLGRGCPGNCTWCGGGYQATQKISGRNKITIRKPQIVANEIIQLKKSYPDILFHISYDPFPKNQDYLIEIFNFLGKNMIKQIHMNFECFALPTKEFVDAFQTNLENNSKIILSPEFGDENMRKKHRSFYFSNTELLNCLDYILNKKIYVDVSFVDLPIENQNSKKATLLLIDKIKQKNSSFLRVIQNKVDDIEPYSPWAINPKKYGMQKAPNLQTYFNITKGFRDFA